MSDLVDWLLEHEQSFRKSRLPSLYSDLTIQKTTNPEGYAANVLAWQNALVRAAEAGELSLDTKLTIQSSEELLVSLTSPQYGRPSSLGLVLDEAVKNGKMLELKDFQSLEQSIYHRSWIPRPWTILQWGLKQAGLTGRASYDKSGRLRPGTLVSIAALEDAYKETNSLQLKHNTNFTDRIMTRDAFMHTYARMNGDPLSRQDTDILLRYLERDKGILKYDSQTVKFKSPTTETPEPLTTEDTTIANLKSLIANLEQQTINLSERISLLQKQAKSAVESKNKPAALSALRSKKLAEATLQQRSETLDRLEEVFAKIEEAVDQIQIVEVMQNSAAVLRGLNKKTGGVERVEDVVEELREEMGKVDEVGQVLQEPLDSGGRMAVDEVEVDEELEEMEREERRKEEEKEAEKTRKRLEELEAVQREELKQEESVERSLRDSTEKLDSMKISGDETREQVAAQAS